MTRVILYLCGALAWAFNGYLWLNQGFENVATLESCWVVELKLTLILRDSSILDPKKGVLDSYNLSIPLDLTAAAATSRYFTSAPREHIDIISTENGLTVFACCLFYCFFNYFFFLSVTMNNHHYGIYPTHFAATPSLSEFFSVLATNKDRQGVEFVSMVSNSLSYSEIFILAVHSN